MLAGSSFTPDSMVNDVSGCRISRTHRTCDASAIKAVMNKLIAMQFALIYFCVSLLCKLFGCIASLSLAFDAFCCSSYVSQISIRRPDLFSKH